MFDQRLERGRQTRAVLKGFASTSTGHSEPQLPVRFTTPNVSITEGPTHLANDNAQTTGPGACEHVKIRCAAYIQQTALKPTCLVTAITDFYVCRGSRSQGFIY